MLNWHLFSLISTMVILGERPEIYVLPKTKKKQQIGSRLFKGFIRLLLSRCANNKSSVGVEPPAGRR